jgi:tetratricopeptide (TPR) repeat protein
MKRLSQLLLLGALILLPVKGVQAEPPKDPIYVKTSNGWTGAYAHGNEYVEFRVIGNGAKLQDPYHILLQKGVGMMVSFVDKKELQNDMDLLSAHAQWELNYWREKANKVESTTREELSGARKDLRITEIRVFNKEGARMTSYLIGLGSGDGVFVLSISPIDKGVDSMVKEIVHSFKLVHKKLDAAEIKRISSGLASPAPAREAEDYYASGLRKHDQGDSDGAIADLTRAIELGSTNPAAYNNRGAEKLKKGDFDGAITDCNRAIELDAEHASAYAIRAYAKDKTGDSDGAMADLGRAIKLNLKNASAYDLRGEIEARKKQYAAANKDERKAIELDPKNGRYYSNVGLCELFNRKPRESITASLKALKLSPDHAVAIKTNLAHAYLFNNQFGKAKAIYLENKDAKLRDGRTFSQVVLDDFKEFQEAGITHPDTEKIKALLTGKAQDTNSTNSH